jgi:nitroimidazol reductase NimA-like FMN-containing flavoprotein (pyridoxamine 5'-phosphate oxidase superfamily)
MRPLSAEEIDVLARRAKWATIVTVRPDGRPYAVEATPFFDGESVCFMINPAGTTRRNLDRSDRVLLKITYSSRDLSLWAGVTLEGTGAFVLDPGAVARGWRLLGEATGEDYSAAAGKFARTPDRSPLFAVKVESVSGRCSARAGEPLPEYWNC